jgi:ABC-2 type transport system permease protein
LANIGSWMNMTLLGFLGALTITIEFSNRTLRQSIIFGMTRLEAAISKLVWSLALALAVTGFYLLLGFILEWQNGAGLALPPVGSVMRFFAQALGYLILGNLVGLLIRKTPLAELAYLAYVMILEPVGRWIFYYSVAKTHLLLYLPNQVLGALTPFPVPESVSHIVESAVQSTASTAPLSPSEVALAALVYLCLFATLFCRRIIKSDL